MKFIVSNTADGSSVTYNNHSDASIAFADMRAGLLVRVYGNGEQEIVAEKSSAAGCKNCGAPRDTWMPLCFKCRFEQMDNIIIAKARAERCRHGIANTSFCAVCTYDRENAAYYDSLKQRNA